MRRIHARLDYDELQVEVDGVCKPIRKLRVPRKGDRRPVEPGNGIRERAITSAERLVRALLPLPESALS